VISGQTTGARQSGRRTLDIPGPVFTAIVSNMPGPDVELRMATAPIKDVYPIVSLARGVPLGVGTLGWNGQLYLSVVTDSQSLPKASSLAGAAGARQGARWGMPPATASVSSVCQRKPTPRWPGTRPVEGRRGDTQQPASRGAMYTPRPPCLPADLSGWARGWRARPLHPSRAVPSWAVACAGLSPALLTVAWLAADALQPASYSPLRGTISALAGYGGTDRWIMTAGLFLVGGCHLAAAAGLNGLRPPARLLLVIAGLCSAGIAASPVAAGGPTSLHLAWTGVGGVTIAVWPAVAGWRAPLRPAVVRARGSVVAAIVFVALFGWVVAETRGGTYLGLAERLASSIPICWPFVVAITLRRATARTPYADRADAAGAAPDPRARPPVTEPVPRA
jgi:uncharacterized protein DUF998/uncharacterized protein DUF1298